jgi:UDP-N-acetylmuramate--alanine ligase
MHIYFSGIGGAGIGPLALIAHQAGYEVSGSDSQHSQYTDRLIKLGILLHIGQTKEQIQAEDEAHPIDWIVFSSAVFITNPNNPELLYAQDKNIKTSKRDECLNMILKNNGLKLIAVAGTHGKTTTTALIVWILKQLSVPISYSVGAKIGTSSNSKKEEMGQFDKNSEYFVYECDEFDRNFLSFNPHLSIITVVDWDHHDIYPTAEDYKQAFRQFINQSGHSFVLGRDNEYLDLIENKKIIIIEHQDAQLGQIKLPGLHNRQNALIAIKALANEFNFDEDTLIDVANKFPGSSRRFEIIAPNIYSDYAHTPEEIAATMQLASEVSDNIVVVYEPLTDRRQHYMKDLYKDVFKKAKKIYWLPSYLAREDPNVPIISPTELISCLNNPDLAEVASKNDSLKANIKTHAKNGDLVICMAGGGGNSLDEWARRNLIT